jgi:hypothetical protein
VEIWSPDEVQMPVRITGTTHASPVSLHLQVHRLTDGTCRPSSKMTPTTTLYPRRSSAVPHGHTPHLRPPPRALTSTHALRT